MYFVEKWVQGQVGCYAIKMVSDNENTTHAGMDWGTHQLDISNRTKVQIRKSSSKRASVHGRSFKTYIRIQNIATLGHE